MLSKDTYKIGQKYNLITKYNIEYDRQSILDYVCSIYILWLLEEKYTLTVEQKNKLNELLNKLLVL